MHSTTTFRLACDNASAPTPRSRKFVRELARVVRQATTLAMRPVALCTRCQFVFILSHMRSGSSLLCHLLSDSEEIIGFGEAHHSYRRRSDLARLLSSVRRYTKRNPLLYRYVLDKIVSAQHEVGAAVLADRQTKYIFLLREPRATIASIVAMSRQYQNQSGAETIAFATDYYTERLQQLSRVAEMIDDPQRCLLLTHRQLIAETPFAFRALESFLDLASPLREVYRLMPTTGQIGIGDPSPNIRRGRIERSLPRNEISLPAELWARVDDAYDTCLAKIRATIPVADSQLTDLRMAV